MIHAISRTLAGSPPPSGARLAGLFLVLALGAGLAAAQTAPAATVVPAESAALSAGPAPEQARFASPEEARDALLAVAVAKDREALKKLFGPASAELVNPDQVQAAADFEVTAAYMKQKAVLQQEAGDRYLILVGEDEWPFPIPVVKSGSQWYFDTEAGREELLNRRIGANELAAIKICQAYVLAQWDYFTLDDWDDDGVAEYAQKLLSTPGQRNGLYWEDPAGDDPSPLGPLVAYARDEGYGVKTPPAGEKPEPCHGYFFRILKTQGRHAPGGAYNYIINGNMIAGYALVAFPAEWGNTGVLTFVVNQQGRVYQKNLGSATDALARVMTTYDPDPSWWPAE